MQENRQKTSPLIIIAIIVQILFTIFAVISIKNILDQDGKIPELKVSNYSEVSKSTTKVEGSPNGIKEGDDTIINRAIYNVADLNNEEKVENLGARVRDGSVRSLYIDELGMYYASFLVDIEKLGQSYQVVYRWVKDPEKYDTVDVQTVMAFCPKKEDLIYGDFDCQDSYKGKGEAMVAYDMVNYKDFGEYGIYPDGDVTSGEQLSFIIDTPSNEEEQQDDAISQLRDYLAQFGIDLEDYDYHVDDVPFVW